MKKIFKLTKQLEELLFKNNACLWADNEQQIHLSLELKDGTIDDVILEFEVNPEEGE